MKRATREKAAHNFHHLVMNGALGSMVENTSNDALNICIESLIHVNPQT
jgi:hypothetical protein